MGVVGVGLYRQGGGRAHDGLLLVLEDDLPRYLRSIKLNYNWK